MADPGFPRQGSGQGSGDGREPFFPESCMIPDNGTRFLVVSVQITSGR